MIKLKKIVQILVRPRLLASLIRGTVPAVEHFEALQQLEIRTCIDVGANVGQFSVLVRYLFPDVTVVAFEPLPEAAEQYERILGMKRITLHRLALGSVSDEANFYVASRRDSSSLLRLGDGQERAFKTTTVATQRVTVRPLGEVIDFARIEYPIFMKIDVQGSELDVLRGCGALLNKIDYVYLEASYVELYTGQPLASEVIDYMSKHGFVLRGVFNQVETESFGPTQADFLFSRDMKDSAQPNAYMAAAVAKQ